MKVLHVFDFFSPHGGGTVDLVYKITRALAQRGHEVAVFTSDFKLDQKYIASLSGVRVYPFHCVSGLGGFYIIPRMVAEVRDHVRDFDIVHLHVARSFQNMVVHRYARKFGVPYVLDTHGSLPRTHGGRGAKWLLKWGFDVAAGYRILRDASQVVAETQVGVNEYKAFGVSEERITLIPPPFPVEELAQLPQRGLFRAKYQLGDRKVVMFLGRIHWIKGIDFLVDGFAELARERNDAALVIVGNDDGYKSTLEAQISRLGLTDRVRFTGFLGGVDKLAALVDADVAVQTSRYEQGAWAPFEAVLCGTPIIVSSNSGAGEDVKRIDAGYLVEYGNKVQLRDAMQYVFDHPAEAREKTDKAREYIKANMSIARGIEKYEALYREVIERYKK